MLCVFRKRPNSHSFFSYLLMNCSMLHVSINKHLVIKRKCHASGDHGVVQTYAHIRNFLRHVLMKLTQDGTWGRLEIGTI